MACDVDMRGPAPDQKLKKKVGLLWKQKWSRSAVGREREIYIYRYIYVCILTDSFASSKVEEMRV